MKFQNTLLVLLVMGAPALYGVKNVHDSMVDQLSVAYNTVFSKANYILQPMTDDQKKSWDTFLAQLEPYIQVNAPDAYMYFTRLKEISSNVIIQLYNNYRNNVVNAFTSDWLRKNGAASFTAFKNQIDINQLKPLGFNNVTLYFKTLNPRLEKILKDLTPKGNELLRGSDSKSAIKILKKLTKDLQGVVIKTEKDANALVTELAYIKEKK